MAFSYAVTLTDPTNFGGALDPLMVTDLQGALADWSNRLGGLGTLVVNLVVAPTTNGRAEEVPTAAVSIGVTTGGATLVEGSGQYELATGMHAQGATSDITVTVDPSYAGTLFLNPSPGNGAAIPANEIDAVSVFRQELGNGLGINGYYSSAGAPAYGSGPGGYLTMFDTLVQANADGTANFIGVNAEAAFGGPVPLTTAIPTENYYHLANAVTDPNGQDLMNGPVLNAGTPYLISGLDLAILQDVGLPVITANSAGAALVLHGTHGQYAISPQQDGSLLVQDTVAGRDGTIDTARYATLAFADGQAIGDTTGVAEDVDRLYQAAFNHPADLAGVQYWSNAIHAGQATLASVAEAFTQTPEFIAGDGALTNGGYVQTLYQNVLGRAGEASGVAFWTGALAGGADRGQVLASFASSGENLARTLPVDGDLAGAEATRLYQAAFNRAPDASGQQFWTSALQNGATPLAVAQGFTATAEFAATYANLADPAFVGQLYANVLHRAGDVAGLQFWDAQLAGGATRAQVLAGFADSNENRVGTAAATHDGWAFLG